MMGKTIAPVHPGVILLEDYLKPNAISMNKLAQAMRVPVNRIIEICKGTRSISGETAVRLGIALRTGPEVWMNLQTRYELEMAEDKYGDIASKDVIPLIDQIVGSL